MKYPAGRKEFFFIITLVENFERNRSFEKKGAAICDNRLAGKKKNVITLVENIERNQHTRQSV